MSWAEGSSSGVKEAHAQLPQADVCHGGVTTKGRDFLLRFYRFQSVQIVKETPRLNE